MGKVKKFGELIDLSTVEYQFPMGKAKMNTKKLRIDILANVSIPYGKGKE